MKIAMLPTLGFYSRITTRAACHQLSSGRLAGAPPCALTLAGHDLAAEPASQRISRYYYRLALPLFQPVALKFSQILFFTVDGYQHYADYITFS